MTREQRLFSAAMMHAELFKPFTMKPVGAPGSPARMEQETQITVHMDLLEALAAYEGSALPATTEGRLS